MGFPPGELVARTTRLAQRLEAQGLGGLIAYGDCWRHSNIGWFSGYRPVDGVGDYPVAVILYCPGEPPVMFVAPGAVGWAQSVSEFEVFPSSELDGKIGVWNAPGPIGLAGANFIPADLRDRLTTALTGRELRASDALAECKAIKSEWEIDLLREAARLNDVAMEHVHQAISSGRPYTEREIARLAEAAMIGGGADGAAFLSMVQSGPRSGWNIALPSDRTIEPGDLVLIDIGAKYRGYTADGGRGFTYGPVDSEKIAMVDAAARAVEDGLSLVKPQRPVSEVNMAIQETLRSRGYHRFSTEAQGHGTGHGTGMDPEEEQPWINEGNRTVLEKDMVFTLKAAIAVPGVGGLRTERIVRVLNSGCEALDKFPLRNHW